MSQTLSVSGVEYIPALAAGKRFGYTREYILLLAREGKIAAQKIGNRWFVDPSSVERFCATTRETVKVRSALVRETRKAELKERAVASRKVHRSHQRTALVETLAILLIGLAVGTMGYVSTPNQLTASVAGGEISIFERVAIALYQLVTPDDEIVNNTVSEKFAEVVPVTESVSETVLPTVTQVAAVPQPAPSMVVAPAVEFSVSQASEVARSFSDPVTVTTDAKNPDTGIIVPHFRDGDGEEYRFLLVPVSVDLEAEPSGG